MGGNFGRLVGDVGNSTSVRKNKYLVSRMEQEKRSFTWSRGPGMVSLDYERWVGEVLYCVL